MRPTGTQRPTAECRPSACGVTPMWSCPRRSGAAFTPRVSSRPTRRSSSARSSSGPIRSTRNLRRALPRLLRSSSESRKIAITCSTTSGASASVTHTSIQRAKRGCEERPPPTRTLKPGVPSSASAPESAMSLMSPRAQSSAQPVMEIFSFRGRFEYSRRPSMRAVDGLGHGVAVGDLVVRDAGEGAAHHVARDVAAGAHVRQAHALVALVDARHLVERDPVHLHALARGAVEEAAGALLGDVGEGLGLVAGEHALHDLRAHHEVPVARVVRVEPVPLEPRHVVGGQGLPAVAGRAHERVVDVEPVLLLLHRLDLVHGRPPRDGVRECLALRRRHRK